MGAERLPMRHIREILRLKHEGGLSHRAIARACGVGVGTVSEYVRRALLHPITCSTGFSRRFPSTMQRT